MSHAFFGFHDRQNFSDTGEVLKANATSNAAKAPEAIVRGPGGTLSIRAGDRAALDLAMLIAGETSGRSLDEVLAEFGRSRSTYFEKLRLFRERGLAGLLSRPTGPRQPWRRSLSVVAQIVMSRLRDPNRGADAIARELAQRQVRVSVRSIERTLSEFGLTRGRVDALIGSIGSSEETGGR